MKFCKFLEVLQKEKNLQHKVDQKLQGHKRNKSVQHRIVVLSAAAIYSVVSPSALWKKTIISSGLWGFTYS